MVYLYKNTLLKIKFVFCLNRFLKSVFDLILVAILITLKQLKPQKYWRSNIVLNQIKKELILNNLTKI